jgi:hypothetical protein
MLPWLTTVAARPVRRKVRLPDRKVSVGDVQARADEGARVDRRAIGDGDAVGVDQHELAVGAQRPGEDRGVLAGHAPQEGRQRTRLIDAHAGTRCDVETLEVDDRLLGGLGDQQAVRGTGVKRDAALHDPRVHRQLAPGRRREGGIVLSKGRASRQCRRAGKKHAAQGCSTMPIPALFQRNPSLSECFAPGSPCLGEVAVN